jgi:membrane-associated protein
VEYVKKLIDLFLHLDQHLGDTIESYGTWTYLILFAIIFCETGLVLTPILPGDSLLFAVGIFAARGSLDVWVVMGLLIVAAILGDTVNYAIGKYVGPKVFRSEKNRWFRREHLERTHNFYERYGGKTIILARFVPIVRTFAPFVAGIGSMSYPRFLIYNVVGGIVWVALFVLAGYKFGQNEFVKNNFTVVVLGIVFVSILPAIFEFVRAKLQRPSSPDSTDQSGDVAGG